MGLRKGVGRTWSKIILERKIFVDDHLGAGGSWSMLILERDGISRQSSWNGVGRSSLVDWIISNALSRTRMPCHVQIVCLVSYSNALSTINRLPCLVFECLVYDQPFALSRSKPLIRMQVKLTRLKIARDVSNELKEHLKTFDSTQTGPRGKHVKCWPELAKHQLIKELLPWCWYLPYSNRMFAQRFFLFFNISSFSFFCLNCQIPDFMATSCNYTK